jgi:hypothetical protein
MKHWTPEEDATLRALYSTTSAGEIARRIGRTRPAVKNRVNQLGLKKPDDATNSGCFVPGQKSWNKGLKGITCGGKETQFKPGHRAGRATELYQPIGTERISPDGYRQRKVNDGMPLHKRWRFVHVIEWEEAHGAVPRGHVIRFINGDKTDIRLDNLECISRRELMARNTVHNYPEDLRQVIRLKAVVTRKINDLSKEQPA